MRERISNIFVCFIIVFVSSCASQHESRNREVAQGEETDSLWGKLNQIRPSCVKENSLLADVSIEFESERERENFCSRLVPEFDALKENFPKSQTFFRLGVQHLVVGDSVSYSQSELELVVPSQLGEADRNKLVEIVTSRPSETSKIRGKNEYEVFVKSAPDELSSTFDDESFDSSGGEQIERCQDEMKRIGYPKRLQSTYCNEVSEHVDSHLSCIFFLRQLKLELAELHDYCLQAKDRMGEYRACFKTLKNWGWSDYENQRFCVDTPKESLDDQLYCVGKLREKGVSDYFSKKRCREKRGNELPFISCVESKSIDSCL